MLDESVKKALKCKIMTGMRERSAMCLSSTGASPGGTAPDSWEGVMRMLSDLFDRGDPSEKAAGVMSACAWIWAHKELMVERELDEITAALGFAATEPKGEAEAEPEAEKPEPAKPEAEPAKA